MNLDKAIKRVEYPHTKSITEGAREELKTYRDLVKAVSRYRQAYSEYEANGQKTTELNDSYADMLVICDDIIKQYGMVFDVKK
jgi:hypothetical protein